MAAPYQWFDDADDFAAPPGRSIGGASLLLQDASSFGEAGTWDAPALISVRRNSRTVTVLVATGRTGDTLDISGAAPGWDDATIQSGDRCINAVTKRDMELIWAAIGESVTADDLADALDDYATTADLATALAGKQGSLTLTTTGSSGAATLVGDVLNIPQYGGGGGGSGTVTSVSVSATNGFAGSVSNASTTPNISLSTSVAGMLKGAGGALTAGVAGTDYVSPSGLTSALASYVALTGAQTLYDKSTQSSGSGDQLKHLNTLGVQASGVDADGNAGGYDLSYLLASGVDLAAGASASRIATWPGKIAEIVIKANVNGASGGFTLTVAKNGSTIATQAVVASNTSVVTIAAGSISDLAIAKGDAFAVSCASSPAPGTGVQSVEVYIKHGRRNR